MIWAVLDTNTLVSGLGWRGSVPAQIFDRALHGQFILVTSDVLLAELRRVLRYPKIAGRFDDPARLIRLIEQIGAIVSPSSEPTALRDPADNRVLAAAHEIGADFIVTGDREMLSLRRFGETRILTPRAFLDFLERERERQ